MGFEAHDRTFWSPSTTRMLLRVKFIVVASPVRLKVPCARHDMLAVFRPTSPNAKNAVNEPGMTAGVVTIQSSFRSFDIPTALTHPPTRTTNRQPSTAWVCGSSCSPSGSHVARTNPRQGAPRGSSRRPTRPGAPRHESSRSTPKRPLLKQGLARWGWACLQST